MRWRFSVPMVPFLVLALSGSAQAAAGPIASRVEGLFWAITGFAFAVSFVVYGALIWFLIRYRRSVSPTAEPIEGNRKLELIWTVIPAIILVIISAISAPVLLYTDTVPPPDYTVRVTAERFAWRFDYYENGNNGSAPDATTSGEMWIQAGSVVRLEVTSVDVIHSFAVNELAVKIDAIPHHVNVWWLRADEPGDYLAQCAEYCGVGHYGMRATIHVFTAEQRQQEAARAGATPKPYGPPPVPIDVIDVRMRETGGNATSPWSIDPPTLQFRLGASVTLRVWNEGTQPYNFTVDVAVDGANYTGPIPPFGNRTIAFILGTAAPGPVPYGPTDPAARAQGMVGYLTIQAGRVIEIHFLEAGCPPPKTFCLAVSPPEDPLRIEKGQPVVFYLRNLGLQLHNFRMDYPEFEVFHEAHIAGGEGVFFGPFTFNEDYSGKYWCDVPGHRALGMEADFIVGEGSAPVSPVPAFEMMLITTAIGVPAVFGYLFHHARRPEEEGGTEG